MDPKLKSDGRGVLRWEALALIGALLLGMAFGPAAASAASAAWVRIKNWPTQYAARVTNWPANQTVTVANSAANPVKTDHPARQLYHETFGLVIYDGEYSDSFTDLEFVPAGRYLTLTGISVSGSGASPIGRVLFRPSGASQASVPISLIYDNGKYWVSGALSGDRTYGPGTGIGFRLDRNTNPASTYSVDISLDGYYSDTP